MRIIAGTARGRQFDAPEGLNTRPTLDRVKESVFGTIQFDIYGKYVLDLFSGSGNMGIEALSRQAKWVCFNDYSASCAALIKNNLNKLGFDNAEVYNLDYSLMLDRMKTSDKKFGLVFLDPPYATGFVQPAIEKLCELDLLDDDAIIIAEHSKQQSITAPEILRIHSVKNYRDTAVTILKK